VKITVDVKSGSVDMMVSTFDNNDEEQNLVDKIPKNRDRAKWNIRKVSSNSGALEREILIKREERNYCKECVYLVGVHTRDIGADYSIMVQSLQADYQNSQFLKLGET
jgi:hypothetical protein